MSPRTIVTAVVGLITVGLGVLLTGCAAGLDAGSASDAASEIDAAASASDAGSDLDATVGDGCYSPEQNLDRAYESGAVGCACTGDDSACFASATGHLVALSCSDGRWLSGEDGECAWAASHAFDEYVVGESCRAFHTNDRGEREGFVLEVARDTLSLWVQRAKGDVALSEWSIDASTYETDKGSSQLIVTGHDLTFSRSLGPATADPTGLQLALRNIAQNQWQVSVLDASTLPDPLPFAIEWFTCERDLVVNGE